jgi:hypothetical protein
MKKVEEIYEQECPRDVVCRNAIIYLLIKFFFV